MLGLYNHTDVALQPLQLQWAEYSAINDAWLHDLLWPMESQQR